MQSDPGVILTRDAIQKLISAHDGDVALLYLWRIGSGDHDPEHAAEALCRTMSEILSAAEKLDRMGLSSAGRSVPEPSGPQASARDLPPQPSDELPEYKSSDIVTASDTDPIFRELQKEAEKVLGKALNTPEASKLLGIYNYLGLPAEVIMTLLHYCAADAEQRYGAPRPPSMRAVEKEAFYWVHHDITSIDRAEEYISNKKAQADRLSSFQEVLGIRGRTLTPSEKRYVLSWIGMGFEAGAVAIAYDRTVLNTGKLTWKYMNSIMESWYGKGLFDPAEIEANDGKRADGHPKGSSGIQVNMDDVRGLVDKI